MGSNLKGVNKARSERERRLYYPLARKRGAMIMFVKGMLVGATLLGLSGCENLAETSRSGNIHEIRFGEHLTPAAIQVSVGDEVRWVNERTSPITVEFLENGLDDITCERGFSNLAGQRREVTTIPPNGSASLCFGSNGTVTYNSRADTAVQGGQQIESGPIQVGSALLGSRTP